MLAIALHAAEADQRYGQKLPFGAAEQAYAAQIHFRICELSQSTNLLNQQFTYVGGTVSNDGPRTIRALEVSCRVSRSVQPGDPARHAANRSQHERNR